MLDNGWKYGAYAFFCRLVGLDRKRPIHHDYPYYITMVRELAEKMRGYTLAFDLCVVRR